MATPEPRLHVDAPTDSLVTQAEPVGVALAGVVRGIRCRVPAGWYLKLTVAQAVLGLTTLY